MRLALPLALAGLTGCYVDGAIGATTPVSGPATDGARNLLSGDVGAGAGIVWDEGGFDLGASGQRIPAGSERNGVGPFGRVIFPVGGPSWLRGTVRLGFGFAGDGEEGGQRDARSVKLSLGTLALAARPRSDASSAMGAGPALSFQWVEVDGVGTSIFIGLELGAIIGGEILTWSDSDPDDV